MFQNNYLVIQASTSGQSLSLKTNTMKQIKSKATLAWVREANQAKYHAIEKLIHVPGDTVGNSIERLQLLIKNANQIIFEMERDRQFIEDNRNIK
jgi:wobble nucleotide-excising tRNase